MTTNDLVARCPTCRSVTDHRPEGHLHRCGSCGASHDLMASLA